MKIPCFLFALAAFTVLPAFAELRDIAIKCSVGTGKEALIFGPAKAPMKASTAKEIRFATMWDLPRQTRNFEGLPIIQPLTPLAFETAAPGWEIRCAAEPVGNLIRLTGVIAYSEPELTQGVFGEQSKPIFTPDRKTLLTENVSKTVTLHTSSSPFQLFAVPGKEYEIKIRQLDKWVRCRITCDYETK